MGDGYNAQLDAQVGKAAKLSRTSNEREYYIVAIRQYDGGEKKVDLARFFHTNTNREMRQPKLGRLSADEARRIGQALCGAADAILGPVKGKGKATRSRKTKPSTKATESPLVEDVQAAATVQVGDNDVPF